MARLKISAVLGAIVLFAAGCAASNPPTADTPVRPDPSVAAPAPVDDSGGLKVSRLDQLWQSRRGANLADFPIGTGDIIAVSVPGLPDFDNSAAVSGGAAAANPETGEQALGSWTVRVNTVGDIILPLLGRIHVAGLTEEQLRAELLRRLGKYMYEPQVEVFVRSYNSRQVAVAGEVHTPGMYTINAPTETIRDLIVRAGGTTDNAAQRIILTPQPPKAAAGHPVNEPISAAQAEAVADNSGANDSEPLSAAGLSGASVAYVIDLNKSQSNDRYLNIPVRPGDTIYVPRAGSATVIGWVYSPKTIDITPNLTVLNAISQAGGTLFAADSSNVKILRQGPGRQTKMLVVNLNDIKAARAPDVLVQANDVIDVSYSAARIPGYALYYAAQGLVSFAPAALIVSGIP